VFAPHKLPDFLWVLDPPPIKLTATIYITEILLKVALNTITLFLSPKITTNINTPHPDGVSTGPLALYYLVFLLPR
jgi:hypothetical protein